jgi:hypothetical protein
MGFETPAAWIARSKGEDSTQVSSTTMRTQGSFAYALTNPGDSTTLTSLPVVSTAKALAGVGDKGAFFEVDVRLPGPQGDRHQRHAERGRGRGDTAVEHDSERDGAEQEGEEENRVIRGALRLFVSCPSRNLDHEFIGKASLAHFPRGTYSTMKFPIPEEVGDALRGVSFDDLTFHFRLTLQRQESGRGQDDREFDPAKHEGADDPTDRDHEAEDTADLIALQDPADVRSHDSENHEGDDERERTGTFLFDNLRVHSLTLLTANTPPPGYGGSVDLVAIANTPVEKTFDIGPVQVPEAFHLKLGAAGTTTVRLDLGDDGAPLFTCTYGANLSDPSGASYALTSCTGGIHGGDLVGANWARLTIVGGDASMKIRAQLAQNPVGDLLGRGVIPAMPTFWGDFDTCVPAPVAGLVVTTSPSCDAQVAQANQIVTDYFNRVNGSNPPNDWIVTPAREGARRHGTGSPHNNLTGPPPPPNDPPVPFDEEGHLNRGGDWDAYWRLSGTLDPENIAGTDRNTTHLDATFATHAVLAGHDVDIVDIKTTIDTDSGETTPTFMKPTSSGSAHFFVFGTELPPGGFSVDPTVGFDVDPKFSQSFDVLNIQIWIFRITIGVNADAELALTGGAAISGVDVKLTPSASVGAHVMGGVNVGIASGGVDAKVSLISVSTPATAQAKWVLNTQADVCAMTLNGSAVANLQLSSAGGKVDLVATFGVCPFCYKSSWTLFKWAPLASTSLGLFNIDLGFPAFQLPFSLCTRPLTVTILSPAPGATLAGARAVGLSGAASSPNAFFVPCDKLSWSFTGPGGATLTPTTGCNPTVTFPQPGSGTATWTINLSASNTYTNQFGTITESGTATPVSVTVTNLPPGVYINEVVDGNGKPVTPTNNLINLGCVPGPFTINGLVNGATGPTNTTFTVTPINGTPGSPITLTPSDPSSSTPSVKWDPHPGALFIEGESYTVTMSTTANGATFGSTTVTVIFFCIP